jgi:MOSC domain-containing protein YiiM
MEELTRGSITVDAGLEGDFRGAKVKSRQITILALEAWNDAMAELGDLAGPCDLPWTTRRANLLVEGVLLPRAVGAQLRIGDVLLEVTGQTNPCHRMEQARIGLFSALQLHWRGGVTCRVIESGIVARGDRVTNLALPLGPTVLLPGRSPD